MVENKKGPMWSIGPEVDDTSSDDVDPNNLQTIARRRSVVESLEGFRWGTGWMDRLERPTGSEAASIVRAGSWFVCAVTGDIGTVRWTAGWPKTGARGGSASSVSSRPLMEGPTIGTTNGSIAVQKRSA